MPGQNQVRIEFVGLDFRSGDELRYQYKLEGADREWSPFGGERTVLYAHLASGSYRFLVRAVSSDGVASAQPAVVSFTVPPHVWQRGWFMALAALAVSSIAWGVHRARVNRLLAIERVRTRIATDLHDDIGSSLSQIVILSEVAQQRALRGESVEPLQRIGGLSRELLESIGDIVWAIQPHKDHLSDLKKRMRHFATEVLSARNVELHWPADEIGRDMELNTEVRREVYLIFKEAINNIARHSRATEARISLRVAERQLTLEVTDNGMGIERFGEDEGNGLRNMKLRAASIKGELQVCSGNGQGTTVVLRVSAGLRLPT
jgi:signal transduction histidine kinase